MATALDTCRAVVDAVQITRTNDQTSYITYCTILDLHLARAATFTVAQQIEVLQTVEEVFNGGENEDLVKAIGWDVVAMLLPFLSREGTRSDAHTVLDIVVRKGNAKEVFLKCTEALKSISWEREYEEEEEDDAETTLAGKLEDVALDENEVNLTELATELFFASENAFKRIQTARPSRFLATFAAALLITVTRAFQTILDNEKLGIIHGLMTSFTNSSRQLCDRSSKEGKDVATLLDGFLTTYVPIYLGNQMLFWSGRYWEESHPILSNHLKSVDLVNSELESGFLQLTDLVRQIGLSPRNLYDHTLSSSAPENIEPDAIYPEGDSYIPVDQVGSLLLLANLYLVDSASTPVDNTDLFSWHMCLVDQHLDDAPFSVVDAILFLGMKIEKHLTAEDMPSFQNPESSEASGFLEYLQRMAASAATCPSANIRPLMYGLVERLLDKCSPDGRLYYILDTIDHCPYENLKDAAVGTLRKQLATAESVFPRLDCLQKNSLFSSPQLLEEIGPRLFGIPEEVLNDEEATWDNANFIIECLSLYRLLLLKEDDKIGIKNPVQIVQNYKAWLLPIRKSVEKWVAQISTKDASNEEMEKLLRWGILLGHLDRIDEVAREIVPHY